MTKHETDGARMGSDDAGEVMKISRDEYERLLASSAPPNPAPAVEEGPHLKKPEIAAAKRDQLKDAKVSGDEEWLTDDMRAALEHED